MPSGFAALDTGFPNIQTMDNTKQQIKAVEDYLVQLLENLRYMLANIGPDNLNQTEVVGWIGETITDPINVRITNDEGQISQLAITAQGLASRVSDAEGNISTLEQTASGLSITVGTLAAQTTVYVNSQGMIIQNGTGQQVKIGNGAVKADFFYGNAYYNSAGTSYMTMETWGQHSSFVVCNGNHDDSYLIVSDLGSGVVNFGASDNHAGSMSFMSFDRYNGIIRPVGTWNFSNATVTGLSTVATFG